MEGETSASGCAHSMLLALSCSVLTKDRDKDLFLLWEAASGCKVREASFLFLTSLDIQDDSFNGISGREQCLSLTEQEHKEGTWGISSLMLNRRETERSVWRFHVLLPHRGKQVDGQQVLGGERVFPSPLPQPCEGAGRASPTGQMHHLLL